MAKFNVSGGIIQDNSLSPLSLVICMIPLSTTQRKGKTNPGGGEKINHPTLMSKLKLHGKNKSEIKGLVCSVEVFSQDIGIEFDIKNCGEIIMNRGKVKSTDGTELPSGEKIRELILIWRN